MLLLLVTSLLLALWLLRSEAPRMPADADHDPDQVEATCLTCHGFRGPQPRPPAHPLRDDCYSCHGDGSGRRHPRPDAPTALPGGWPDDPRLNPPSR